MEWFLKNWATLIPIIVVLLGGIGYLLKTYVFVPKKKESAPKVEDSKPQLSSEQIKSQLKPQVFTPALVKSLMEIEAIKRSGKLHERAQELSASELLNKNVLMEKELEAAERREKVRKGLPSTEPPIKLSPTAKVEYILENGQSISQSITNWAIPQDAPPTTTCLVTRIKPSKFVDTKPSPNEIAQYVSRLTPYQKRHEPVKIYDGIEISWRSWFGTIDLPHFENPDTSAFFNPYAPGQMIDDLKILCHFSIAGAPRFRTIHRGTPVGISGTIEQVNAVLLLVTIKNPHFFFFD
jgi:hypothetical protein